MAKQIIPKLSTEDSVIHAAVDVTKSFLRSTSTIPIPLLGKITAALRHLAVIFNIAKTHPEQIFTKSLTRVWQKPAPHIGVQMTPVHNLNVEKT